MSESSKKYLERLRKRVGKDKIPTAKEVADKAFAFVQENEDAFLKWAGEKSE